MSVFICISPCHGSLLVEEAIGDQGCVARRAGNAPAALIRCFLRVLGALQLRGTGAHAIMMNQCANVTLNGLTMHNVGMFWIIDWAGMGNTVRALSQASLF